MYRIIPLRTLRKTKGVLFDEIVPSDIPKISGIDRVIHKSNSISPGPIENVKRPWYMHPSQDDNLLVLQGTRYVDIYCPVIRKKQSFIITPEKIWKNGKLYCNYPAMIVWPSGIFHRIISGEEGSISVNLSTRMSDYDIKTNFNIYDLNITTGEYKLLKKGMEDQPDLDYKYPNDEIRKLVES